MTIRDAAYIFRMHTFGGIILCGGHSSRMGRAKAWLPFGAEFLLQRVVRVVGSVVNPVVVVAAIDQELPVLPKSVEIVRDFQPDSGPLAGFAAGLAALEGRVDAVYLASCDTPGIDSDFVRFVIAQLGNAPAAVPMVAGFSHPLSGVYRLSARAAVDAMLAAGELRMRDLLPMLPAIAIPESALPNRAGLVNINTPEEYKAALTRFSRLD